MIHTIFPYWPILPVAAAPPGDISHGIRYQTDRRTMGRVGPGPIHHQFQGGVSQLSDYSDEPFAADHRRHCPTPALQHGHGSPGATTLSKRRRSSPRAGQIAGPNVAGNTCLSQGLEEDRRNLPAQTGLWFFHLVGGAVGTTSGPTHRDSLQRRSTASDFASRRFLLSAAQAYPQGQTQRNSLSEGPETLSVCKYINTSLTLGFFVRRYCVIPVSMKFMLL